MLNRRPNHMYVIFDFILTNLVLECFTKQACNFHFIIPCFITIKLAINVVTHLVILISKASVYNLYFF